MLTVKVSTHRADTVCLWSGCSKQSESSKILSSVERFNHKHGVDLQYSFIPGYIYNYNFM